MKFTINISIEQAKALAVLGFDGIGYQLDSLHRASSTLINNISNISSIIRYTQENPDKNNHFKLKILVGLCHNIVTEDTEKYFFSIDPNYGCDLAQIRRSAEFMLEYKEYKQDSMLLTMDNTFKYLAMKIDEFIQTTTN